MGRSKRPKPFALTVGVETARAFADDRLTI
jgi:hypothetical protein